LDGAADEDHASHLSLARIASIKGPNPGLDINQDNTHIIHRNSEESIDKCNDIDGHNSNDINDDEHQPDPVNQQLDSLQPTGESEGQSSIEEREEESSGGLDLDELCGLAEDEDIKMYLDFITWIENASLEDDGMKIHPDDLNRLHHPPQANIELDDPDLWLTLNLFLAMGNSSEETYNSVHKAIQHCYPKGELLSYHQIKHCVSDLSSVIHLARDMCLNTCIAY